MRIYKDFSGEKVGMLTIQSFANKRNTSGSVWNAVCECGNKKEIASREIRRAKKRGYMTSCGECEGSPIISKKNPNKAAFAHLYNIYKGGAKRRNLSFNLNWDEFHELTSKDCFYCGQEPNQKCYNSSRVAYHTYNGIDRVDSSIGYVKENCVPCCGTCNLMKSDMSVVEFYNHLEKILKHKACPSFDARSEYLSLKDGEKA